MLMKRRDVLRRYRNLRAICTRHRTAAVKFLAQPAIMESARRLGLTAGHVLIADSTEELTLVFDLAIYTAKEGRTRAIDRYAKAAQLPAGSDEMRMLEAMCCARFSTGGSNAAMTLAVSSLPINSDKPRLGWSMRGWPRLRGTACASPVGCATRVNLPSPTASWCPSSAR